MKHSSNLFSDTALFDNQAFVHALSNAGDSLDFYKQALNKVRKTHRQRFFEGIPAAELIRHRAWIIDHILKQLWQYFLDDASQEVALVAVGGYGRGELHPGSDVDIMVLLQTVVNNQANVGIQKFNNFLWDIGIEPGLSVRNISDCQHAAKADVTVISNLLESRLICGPIELFKNMREVIAPDQMWSSQDFFKAKLAEQQQRYSKYHDTAYNLEPNIKEGPGGLRDIHTLAWVAKRQFHAHSLHDLLRHEFLTQAEYHALIESQNFLWNIRFALHTVAKRREDRLLFDHQRELALLFGYCDDENHLAVEHFMKRYYRTAMEISRMNEMLLQLFQEAILFPDKSEPQPINNRFQARNGFVEIIEQDIFKKYPFALLEIFLVLEQYPELKGVRATTIRSIRAHHYLIDNNFRRDLRCRSLFMEIIKQPRGVTHELRRMNRYGVLAAYLPVFAKIVGQMQYDLFHVYTVDEHSLFVLRNLRRLCVPEFAHEFPSYSRIISNIPKHELLYLAALFHDIAKGRGGNHSELGADDAKGFCLHHGLSQYDADFVGWLVKQHLLMSMTAHRKDISDSDVVAEFAKQVETPVRLDNLYLLTVADIRATNPTLWNNWREALLAELYSNTKHFLEYGERQGIGLDDAVIAAQKEALALLKNKSLDSEHITEIWNQFGSEYFVRCTADEIAWHTQGIASIEENNLPLILIRSKTQRGNSEIFLYTRDQERLFAVTTSLLDQLNLNIVDARIITSKNGYTLDCYIVLEPNGEAINSASRILEIKETLQQKLKNPDKVTLKVNKHIHTQFRYFKVETKIEFQHDAKNNRTIMSLSCSDRPGLLSRVGQAFVDCNVHLKNAKIATYGARAEDVFFVTNSKAQAISHSQQQCLQHSLNKLLGSGLSEQK